MTYEPLAVLPSSTGNTIWYS